LKWIDQRRFVSCVNQAHPQNKREPAEIDWQEDQFFDFHNSFYKREYPIEQSDSSKIVRDISQQWGLRIEQLYPENPSKMNYSWGHSLSARHGVIWVEPQMMYPSYVFHEIAHVLLECFINYDLKGKSKLREEGHGILFAAIMYDWLTGYYSDDEAAITSLNYWFKAPRLYKAPSEVFEHFRKLFKSRSLL
jgi:hypothetical protein